MKHCCIAVIPVRGASKGIPRKNARLLGGKPLMVYAIEAAQKAKCFSDIIVSTDDEELAYIAFKNGVSVLVRPKRLAGDHIGLDSVIGHAVLSYEKDEKCTVDYIATIQATCPLLSAETIKKAVSQCVSQKKDTVLTVIEDTHLGWKVCGKKGVLPDYKKRLNRQQLPKHYRETGGVVVCSRGQLQKGTRFGRKIGVIECDKKESIDIDDHFDWWLAEKQLQRKRIVLRTEGYGEIGLGHIYRTLTLADNMLDHDVIFVVSRKSALGKKIICSRFYPLIEYKGGLKEELRAIESCAPDIVVNDILDTSSKYIKALKKRGYRVINFEDKGLGRLEADCVINAMYGDVQDKKYKHIVSGTEYICLRDEFYSTEPVAVNEKVQNVLVLFGGTDPGNLTEKTLQWLIAIPQKFDITVIVGPGYGHLRTLKEIIAKGKGKHVDIVTNTKVITKYMEKAELAVTSAGRTVFELAALGIPMIVIAQNKRETQHAFLKNKEALAYLGLGGKLRKEKFISVFERIFHSFSERKRMQSVGLKHDFKKGIYRVWDIILEK